MRWYVRALWLWPLGWGFFAAALTLATLFSVLTLRWRVNLWFPVFSRVVCGTMLKLCGVKVDVVGHPEALAGRRARIVTFNHTSQLDMLAFGSVMPDGGTAVGKKEMLYVPFLGLAFWSFRFPLVNRGNSEAARSTMAHTARRFEREQLTVAISPEGTRSKTGDLQPFKMGAFHLALATGAPLVPVLMLGNKELQPLGSILPLPGRIRFEVLSEITTGDYRLENLKEQRDGLWALYQSALSREKGPTNKG